MNVNFSDYLLMLSASQQQALTSPIPKPIIHTIHSCISLLFFFQNFCWNFEKFHILKKRKSLKINLFEVFFLLISKHIVCSFISLRSCKESNHFSHQSRFASNCKQSFKVTWLDGLKFKHLVRQTGDRHVGTK